jgi:uncharacterized protein GlcG (DUF336 family)
MNRALVASAVFCCALRANAQCTDGAIGSATPETFAALSAGEVDAIVKAAASALNVDTATIAVVDRAGRVLGVFRQPRASANNDDLAVGTARTAAFFSHDMAPLSSRTVRFISGVHFPPGVQNAPPGALYGIENTNRGCDTGVIYDAGKDLPRPTSLSGGVGTGIVTGKLLPDDGPYPQRVDNRPVNAGGIPLYRILDASRANEGEVSDGKVVGGIGVVGIAGDPQLAEYAAATGAFAVAGIAPVPRFPLPFPGNVIIDGIRLPFLGDDQRLRLNDDGLPVGLQPPSGTSAGTIAGTYVVAAKTGGCTPNEYLVAPTTGVSPLTEAQVAAIVERGVAAAKKTRGAIRLPLNSYARMVIAVADTNGKILALYRMPDATVFSVDVAITKARNVVSASSGGLAGFPSGVAVTNRTLGFMAQPLYPPGIDRSKPGPYYSIFLGDLTSPCSLGSGRVFFAGSTPLYVNGKIAGGLGVSGDGVEQDDYVTVLAAGEFLPDKKLWADRIVIDKVRLPMFKFPRQPEGVTECGGKPCS